MMFSGCDLGDKNNEPLSDAELIQMIIDASKLEIDMDDLPEQSLEYINNDISYDEIASRVASGLGFEVELVGNGTDLVIAVSSTSILKEVSLTPMTGEINDLKGIDKIKKIGNVLTLYILLHLKCLMAQPS